MYDVIIIGAGVSGIFCTINLNKNLKVLLIDKNEEIGKKLALTGKGRCNITNISDHDEFLSNVYNHKFLYSSLSRFNNYDLIDYCYQNNILLKEEDHGRMILKSEKSAEIIEHFAEKIKNFDLLLNTEVISVVKDKHFTVKTPSNSFNSKIVVVATGGKSYPQTGSTGFGYEIGKNFSHTITDLVACEAPIYSNDELTSLTGLTLNSCALIIDNKKHSGYNLLITHFGLSGPLALRQSHFITSNNLKTIFIDFYTKLNSEEMKTFLNSNRTIKQSLNTILPKSLTNYLLNKFGEKVTYFNELSNKQLDKLIQLIKKYQINITSYPSIEKGFVTAGGINTKEINSKTFESKLVNNLYFIGETVDVHAHTGGYNITIFFSMAYSCSLAINAQFD